jgi:hypothetical protein
MRPEIKMRVMSIVHGKSELCICSSIKSNLRIKQEIIARDRGENSIQVTSLMDVLNDSRYRCYNNFVRHFSDVEHEKHKLINFRLFPIMDLDDCTPTQMQNYINKRMFAGHWLYDYITPIYNEPNLESTMGRLGISIEIKKDYVSIFPTNHGDLDVNIAKEYCKKFNSCGSTNLDEYFKYCLEIINQSVE